jgi:hypothetical protein
MSTTLPKRMVCMPIPRSPPDPAKWQTVRSALTSWSRTLRLCLICLSVNVPVDVLAWLVRRLSLLWVPGTCLGTHYSHVGKLSPVQPAENRM